MNKETLNALREAVDGVEYAINEIKLDESLEPGQKETYLEILDRALTDIEFTKSHYDLSLYTQEHPEKAGQVINPE